jgi:hypothetical protein
VNDLQAISFSDFGLSPLVSRDNLQIPFDSYPISREPQPIHKGGQCQVLWYLARLAVKMNTDQNDPHLDPVRKIRRGSARLKGHAPFEPVISPAKIDVSPDLLKNKSVRGEEVGSVRREEECT